MTSPARLGALMLTASLLVPGASMAGPIERFTLVVGANHGGSGRAQLKYAVSDAERFALVMADLGGVSAENELLLKEPRVRDLLLALETIKTRLAAARKIASSNGGRTELFFYYSGHADEQGLLLGDDRLSYRSLRDRLDDMPADVRIAVLDACASGAFTRLKGGRKRLPFQVDESSAMRGHAFLTSSADTEAAQESDRIHASYFTHYLVSGFRGAADLSGDGKVTLNEAYQFAFTETLGRTLETKAGAQHPSYDINLSGAGDVVITDVRQTTARIVLGAELDGRFYIRNSAQRLVVELYKPRGREVEIALEPDTYTVRLERDASARVARIEVSADARVVLAASQLAPAQSEPTRRRGDDLPQFAVNGRNRVTMQTGLWGSHGGVAIGQHGFDYFSGLQYARYLREDLAVTAAFMMFGVEDQIDLIGGMAIPLGLQWNPRRGQLDAQALKPFLSVGLVPVSSANSETQRRTTLGVHVGAGFDWQVVPTFAVGLQAGVNAVPERDNPSGLHDNFGGPELSIRLGWLFGRTRPRP